MQRFQIAFACDLASPRLVGKWKWIELQEIKSKNIKTELCSGKRDFDIKSKKKKPIQRSSSCDQTSISLGATGLIGVFDLQEAKK